MNIESVIESVKNKEPLFTALVTQLSIREDSHTPTLGTDGENLLYNQKFLGTLTFEEACGVVLHEVLHCAFGHPWRKGKRNHLKWNIATDYAINGIVNETFALPKGSLLDTRFYGMSADKIYDMLPNPKKIKVYISKNGDGSEDGEESGEGQQSWCEHDKWSEEKKNGSKEMSEKEKQLKAHWERLFEQNILKQYGKLPNSIQRIVNKSYYVPVVDWDTLVSKLLSEDTNDYSFSMPDRRFLENDFLLPDMSSVDRLKDVVFAYDTSGSISEDDLLSYYMETLNLFSNFYSLSGWVAICDAVLHSFKEIQPQMVFSQFSFKGGGGTSFYPVFDEVKKRDMQPKALFYFTDCEGDFPHEEPRYPVFWLVRNRMENGYSKNVPFGTVINFMAKTIDKG